MWVFRASLCAFAASSSYSAWSRPHLISPGAALAIARVHAHSAALSSSLTGEAPRLFDHRQRWLDLVGVLQGRRRAAARRPPPNGFLVRVNVLVRPPSCSAASLTSAASRLASVGAHCHTQLSIGVKPSGGVLVLWRRATIPATQIRVVDKGTEDALLFALGDLILDCSYVSPATTKRAKQPRRRLGRLRRRLRRRRQHAEGQAHRARRPPRVRGAAAARVCSKLNAQVTG